MSQTLLKTALVYARRGFSIIPCREKKPIVEWKKYQKVRADEAQIRQWWTEHPDAGIGIVTGAISGLYVVDSDGPNGTTWMKENTTLEPTVKTPRDGYHYYTCGGNGLGNATNFLPELDFRGEGGYIVAAPTRTSAGAYILMGAMPAQFAQLPDAIKLMLNKQVAPSGTMPAPSGTIVAPSQHHKRHHGGTFQHHPAPSFSEGERDDKIFNAAVCLLRGGMPVPEAQDICCMIASTCVPPFPAAEARAKVISAAKRKSLNDVSIQEQITNWVMRGQGDWTTRDLYNEFNLLTAADKKYARKVVQVLRDKNVIEPVGKKRGIYRRIERDAPVIDILSADAEDLDIRYPLGIENFFRTMPKNIIVVAGEQDSGKSAFALNFAAMNVGRGLPVRYCSSEMGAVELRDRLKLMKEYDLKHLSQVDFRERQTDFHDLILPDGITIIDFLEITDNFWLVADALNKIHLRLKSGICIVLIQKDDKQEYGRGASFGKEKPRLYLTLENNYPAGHIAKVKKCKNWRSPKWNPNGKRIDYKIVNGIEMRILTKWEA